MKNGKGLLKTAGMFGFLLALTHTMHRRKSELKLKSEKKRRKKAKRKMKKAIKRMEEIHARPPVRVPTDPNSRN